MVGVRSVTQLGVSKNGINIDVIGRGREGGFRLE